MEPVEPKTEPLERGDRYIFWGILLGATLLFWATSQMGFPRDESFYFHAAYEYFGWFEQLWQNLWAGDLFESFTDKNIQKHWDYNGEHPVLVKTLFALSHALFHRGLGLLGPSDAMRLPAMVFGALTVALTYAMGRQIFGRLAGLVAAGSLLFQPRFFFHSHLSCFDVPIAALWLASIYAYWRSYGSRKWVWYGGLIWGLALSAKLNAFFIPVVLVLHWLAHHWYGFRVRLEESNLSFRLPKIPLVLVSMALVGPIVFYLLWPRLWHHPIEHLQWYLNFHLEHTHYFVLYFGENMIRPPFPISYPWVLTLVTVPATILLAVALGLVSLDWRQILGDWWRRWKAVLTEFELPEPAPMGADGRHTLSLLFINAVFPVALIGMPDTPIFGGTKHWMPAMPFWAIFAGAGAQWCVQNAAGIVESWMAHGRAVVASVAAAAVILPAVYATGYNHPFGTSYYNELIGSYRGAADQNMMRQYWGYASKQALPWVNEHASKNARIWPHNTTGYAWDMYAREGLVRSDLDDSGLARSDYALFHHQKAFSYRWMDLWREYGKSLPVHVVSIDGVPLLSVYKRGE